MKLGKIIFDNNKNFVPAILFVLGATLLIFGLVLSPESKSIPQSSPPLEKTPNDKIVPTLTSQEHSKNLFLVTKAFDGDTIEIDTGERVRYLGINAPEKGQPYSKESTTLNSNLVLNKNVQLEYDIQTKDRYGRTLAYVFVNNQMVNLEMVKNGLAVSETIQPNVKYQDEFVEAQKEARDNCLGMWRGLCEQNSTSKPEGNKCIKIASIKADALGDDNKNKNGEWIEIKNQCDNPVLMNNWLLKDNSASNKYEFKNYSLSSQRTVTLYSGCGTASEDKLYWQCPEGKYAIWNNAGDHAYLYDSQGNLVSDFGY